MTVFVVVVVVLKSNHRGSHIPSLGMVHAGCVFVAGIRLSRTSMSGSFESVRWNACVHRLGLGLYSHPKEFWGNGVRTHVNCKGRGGGGGGEESVYQRLRGGWNPRRCITQDSQPNTLPTELFRPSNLSFRILTYSSRSSKIPPRWPSG